MSTYAQDMMAKYGFSFDPARLKRKHGFKFGDRVRQDSRGEVVLSGVPYGAEGTVWAIAGFKGHSISPDPSGLLIFVRWDKHREGSVSWRSLTKIGSNPERNLYEQFHGTKSKGQCPVYFEPPKGPLIKIGRITRIEYKPESPSKHTGTIFFHDAGDLGGRKIHGNAILATNQAGTQLYIVREDRNVKYPVFSPQGILG